MKKSILIILLSILSFCPTKADEISGKISYFPVVIGCDMPEASKKLIVSKMDQALTQNGLGSMSRADRFVMLAKCNVIDKNIAPTTPPRISQKVEITFILGDVVENKTYGSATIELSGMGVNETKAWQTALNGIKASNPIFKQLFEEASEKIAVFYAGNCESIIAMARTLASTGKSDEAIANLMAIPDICHDCYENAMSAVSEIYQSKVDDEGAALLAKAKNAWSASPDDKGADLAMSYLNKISVTSSSFPEAEVLAATISKKLSSDKEREWQLKLQKYNDDKEFRTREQANSHARSMATIAAARSVAEKWAENQPETKVYYNW